MWAIFKAFNEFFNILLKLYVLGFGHEAYGILALRPGIKPTPPTLEGEVFHFTTGSLGKSVYHFGFFRLQIQVLSYDVCLYLRNRYLKRSVLFHLLKLSYTTRILGNAFVLFSGVLPSVVLPSFLPQALKCWWLPSSRSRGRWSCCFSSLSWCSGTCRLTCGAHLSGRGVGESGASDACW